METVTTPAVLPAQTRTHHPFSPSKMNYFDDCAAFLGKEGSSAAAEEGTFLHDIMERVVKEVTKKRAATTLEQIDGWVTKSYELDDDQISLLRFCCKKVDAFLAKNPTVILVEVTAKVTKPDGKMLNQGFLDVLLIFSNGVGILIDYKFGGNPVRPAHANLQGIDYAVGVLQQYPQIKAIGVCFIQPKLGFISEHLFKRSELPVLLQRLMDVVERVKFVRGNPDKARQFMAPGLYCDYCSRAGNCAALASYRQIAAAKYSDLPVPPSFKGLELSNPEDIALARYWVDVIEKGLDDVKTRAMEAAKLNGGSISCKLPNGEEIVYEVATRRAARSLGSAREVAEALREILTPEEVLAAAELKITALEPIVKNAAVELAKASGQKLTKKAAWESAQATLEAVGLLSRPDGSIEFLSRKKTAQLIENKTYGESNTPQTHDRNLLPAQSASSNGGSGDQTGSEASSETGSETGSGDPGSEAGSENHSA